MAAAGGGRRRRAATAAGLCRRAGRSAARNFGGTHALAGRWSAAGVAGRARLHGAPFPVAIDGGAAPPAAAWPLPGPPTPLPGPCRAGARALASSTATLLLCRRGSPSSKKRSGLRRPGASRGAAARSSLDRAQKKSGELASGRWFGAGCTERVMKTENAAIALHLQRAAQPPPPHAARFAAARFPRLPHTAGSGVCPGHQGWSSGTNGDKLHGVAECKITCSAAAAKRGQAETGRQEQVVRRGQEQTSSAA